MSGFLNDRCSGRGIKVVIKHKCNSQPMREVGVVMLPLWDGSYPGLNAFSFSLRLGNKVPMRSVRCGVWRPVFLCKWVSECQEVKATQWDACLLEKPQESELMSGDSAVTCQVQSLGKVDTRQDPCSMEPAFQIATEQRGIIWSHTNLDSSSVMIVIMWSSVRSPLCPFSWSHTENVWMSEAASHGAQTHHPQAWRCGLKVIPSRSKKLTSVGNGPWEMGEGIGAFYGGPWRHDLPGLEILQLHSRPWIFQFKLGAPGQAVQHSENKTGEPSQLGGRWHWQLQQGF